MMKPTVHVDEFSSKMGTDDEIVVVSFFVRDLQAAKDLMHWFEKGYDFVLDADRSPGEIRPNRYLVYVELRRRSNVGENINTLLEDLKTLTEHELDDWILCINEAEYPWSIEQFNKLVATTPREYRQQHEGDLNEMRIAAGLAPKKIYERDQILKALQHSAGI
jgi:hypothetical protein